jgi:YegS/Rv2252/BmrU family lipid kinase
MNLKRAIIIYNPMSGRPGRRAANARAMTRLLEARGLQVDAFATNGPGDASRLASNAVADRVDIIVSYGGDGTLNEVIQGVAMSETALAVWPGGTANVVARDIGMMTSIERLADIIAAGMTKRVALGRASSGGTEEHRSEEQRSGGVEAHSPQLLRPSSPPPASPPRYFLMMAGIGIDASIARGVNHRLKRATGEFAYWWCGIKHLFFGRAARFSSEVDGKHYESAFALVGNGKGYGGGMMMTPGARLEEPWFEVFILPPQSNNFAYLRALAACRKGTPEAGGATLIRGRHIKANSADDPWVEVDGEVIGPLPMTFDIVPDALSIIVP